jgi:hypothetical protein
MKKKLCSLFIIAALTIATLTVGTFAADTTVPFPPGSGDLNGANPGEGELYVDEGNFFVQAFNVKQAFKGFKFSAYGADEAKTVKYELFYDKTDLDTSIEGTPVVCGTFEQVSNNLDGQVLFEKEIPAGKYVLLFTTVSGDGYFALAIRPGTQFTDFACSEGMRPVDFGFFTFNVLDDDPTIMVGGLIFGKAADAGVYLEMSADPVNPASDDKPGPGETENPGKTGNPGKTDPPKTGDAMVMVPIAAACVILSILLLKKRQEA